MNLLVPICITTAAVFSYFIGKTSQRTYRDLEILEVNFRNRRLTEKNARLCCEIVRRALRDRESEKQSQNSSRIKFN